MLLMEVTPVIMLHIMSGSTIILSRLRNTSPNNAMALMTCSGCMRGAGGDAWRLRACLLGLNVLMTAPAANPNTTPTMV